MSKKSSEDPRTIRARQAFQQALQDLLETMPYEKITVTDISRQSGRSRHTFYNHYDSKDELLNSMIDSILEGYFANIGPWLAVRRDSDGNIRIGQRFFEIWYERADVTKLLNKVDFDCLLIDRLKSHFAQYFDEYFPPKEVTGASDELIGFVVSLLAYSYAGVLRQWFLSDLRYTPEIMGRFLNHFAGAEHDTVIEAFKDVIR